MRRGSFWIAPNTATSKRQCRRRTQDHYRLGDYVHESAFNRKTGERPKLTQIALGNRHLSAHLVSA
jgi:hypothetical protein